MSGEIVAEPTRVPIDGGKEVRIDPDQPYPAPYRGSKYSIIESRRNGIVLEWKYNDLVVHVKPPEGLHERLRTVGKSEGDGTGSLRITSGGEVLTKVHRSSYAKTHDIPRHRDWIPVYIGQLSGDLGFDIDNDPTPPDDSPWIWGGFPFNHGERWSVSYDDQLIWTWQEYRIESAFDHPELVKTYNQYRTNAGRLYLNEFGNVFINAPRDQIPPEKAATVEKMYSEWQHHADRNNHTAAKRLVNRRLKVTGDGDPSEGHLPLYIGHLSEYDGGVIPKPVVTEQEYYVAIGRDTDGET